MGVKLLVMLFIMKTVVARITINLDENLNIRYSGTETRVVSSEDIHNFNIGEDNLKSGLEKIHGRRPSDACLTKTPWAVYEKHNLEKVKKVVSIKSARVTSISKKPVVVVTQDFENSSNHTIKVNAGISHSVQNTLTTSVSSEHAYTVSQEIEYVFDVAVARVGGKTGFSYTYRGGSSEQKSIAETIGATSGVEVELEPGDAVTAVLSAEVGVLDIEVVNQAYLKGTVVANFYPPHNGHYFWFSPIGNVLAARNAENNFVTTETIKLNYYVDAKLNVHSKKRGRLV